MACVALTSRGNPCRYSTPPDAPFCPNHDPENVDALAAQNAANGRQPRPGPAVTSSSRLTTGLYRACLAGRLDTNTCPVWPTGPGSARMLHDLQ